MGNSCGLHFSTKTSKAFYEMYIQCDFDYMMEGETNR